MKYKNNDEVIEVAYQGQMILNYAKLYFTMSCRITG